MARYTNEPCFLCGSILTEADDVVVCPDCGTPYHRACWKKNNCCVNTQLHTSGEGYQPVFKADIPEKAVCPNCGTPNLPDAAHCKNCGAALHEAHRTPSWEDEKDTDDPSAADSPDTLRSRLEQTAGQMGLHDTYCGMDQEDTLGGERLGDVADFVESNTLYYLPKFQRFHQSGRRLSLNLPCLLFPHLYLANRKMWIPAMILTAILALLDLPQTALALQETLPDMITAFQDSKDNMLAAMYPNMTELLQNMQTRLDAWENAVYNTAMICNYAAFFLMLCAGLFGNYFYYRFVLKRVGKIRSENLPEGMHRTRLRMQGGTNGWLMLGMIALKYIFSLLLTMILFIILMF